MRLTGPSRRTPIGLDIGARHVKAVQLHPPKHGGTWKVAAAMHLPRAVSGGEPDREEVRRIADVLARRGFVGNQIVIPVPGEKLISSVLEIPAKAAGAPVEQIARMELARTSRRAPETFEMGCWPLPAATRAGRSAHVMAVGCPHDAAEAALALFEAEGLDVVTLDVRGSALARAAAPLAPPGQGVWAVLDLGWGGSMLVMLHGGAVVYARPLAEGGMLALYEMLRTRLNLEGEVIDYLISEVGLAGAKSGDEGVALPPQARDLLASHLDALVRELTISLSYVTHEYPDAPLARLLLSGTAASVPGLAQHLSDVLGVEARLARPTELASCPPPLLETCASPALLAAMGLAQFREE